ncbi:MAG: AAA family ATPase [Sulfuricurvum sp.]|jgi:DNA polymerase-3 subunit gamma/tau|nr:AAA family ATPase [Sulfuricurvum sp.]
MADREELHLKYRPKTFDELIGNNALKESLLSAIGRTRTFLFYGPRGCGKTTIARLIAAKLEIAEIDINEIDAADNTGVDNARQIKEAAQYSPMGSKYKIYIIDECHRLTGNAFDSLLKTLEAPPSHCYFVLCTTELQKVPTTIKSRSKCYEVKVLNTKEQNFLIRWICHEEKITITPEVKQTIMECCEGIPREIIVALDTVRDVKNDEDAISLINAAVHREVKELCQALLNNKNSWETVAGILKELKDDPERIRMAVLGYMNQVLLNSKRNDRAAFIIQNFKDSFVWVGKAGLSYAAYMSQTTDV